MVDRRAIGVETRYTDSGLSIFGKLDYDIHFNTINLALINASYTFPSRTTLNVSVDSRRTPILRTSNALIGQSGATVDDMLVIYPEEELRQIALDRSAKSRSLYVSLNHPLSERFSLGVDATFWNLSGTPASAGVPATPSPDTAGYYSLRLVGSSVFVENDLVFVTAGYSDAYNANRYTFDVNARVPLMQDLRVGPRVLFNYRKSETSTRVLVRPSLRIDYRLRRNFSIEVDAGTDWQKNTVGSTITRTWNYVFNIGARLDF